MRRTDDMEVIFYTTGCPKCSVLKKKLDEKGIPYRTETNVDEMMFLGISQVPMLMVDGELMGFVKANTWVNEQ